MALMLAPIAGMSFSTSDGVVYTANDKRVIYNVASQDHVDDLVMQGCALLNPPPTDLLFKLEGANFNTTSDQILTPLFNGKFRIRRIVVLDTSVNGMSTAAGGFYTGAGKTGTTIVANTQVYTGLTNANTAIELTLAAASAVLAAGTPLYFALTTAQGAAATADIYVYGDVYD